MYLLTKVQVNSRIDLQIVIYMIKYSPFPNVMNSV